MGHDDGHENIVEEAASCGAYPGFRMTRQRRLVYNVLLRDLDHPTASDVFLRAKDELTGISLATVYNCLETLTEAGLVRQVNLDREPSRYCPNLHDHAHFFCLSCGAVEDIAPVSDEGGLCGWRIPEGNLVEKMEVAMRGLCKSCAANQKGTQENGVATASGRSRAADSIV